MEWGEVSTPQQHFQSHRPQAHVLVSLGEVLHPAESWGAATVPQLPSKCSLLHLLSCGAGAGGGAAIAAWGVLSKQE